MALRLARKTSAIARSFLHPLVLVTLQVLGPSGITKLLTLATDCVTEDLQARLTHQG